MYYELCGAEHEEALVYLHGGPGASCLDFELQAKAIGKHKKVIALDQWGVLRSGAINETDVYSMNLQIEMLEEMRRLLGIKTWSALGHSYGGALAVLYAYTYPQSIDKLILECPSLDFVDSAKSVAHYMSGYIHDLGDIQSMRICEKIKATEYHDHTVVDDLLKLLSYVKEPKLRNYLHGVSFEAYQHSINTNGITNDMWGKADVHFRKLMDDELGNQRKFPLDAKMWDSFLPLVAQLHLPTLLIRGKYDPACTDDQANYLLQHVPDSRQVIFQNSGHFPRIEEPDAYTSCVVGFLNE